jgi:group II intron reverse transcriptase/maturase
MDTEYIVSTKMEQIALNAKRLPDVGFTSLSHHIDLVWLYEAFKNIKEGAATGIDKVTAAEYRENLKENLKSLLERAKSGKYKAPPVRRVYIPKAGSKEMRPIGIPTYEDKVLQKAVAWTMEPIYEQDFYECSYGFRRDISPHDALKRIWKGLMGMGGGWIIDLDIRKFFDTIQWKHLREVIKLRVQDGVIIRLIGKWMNAGVMEEAGIKYPEAGTPQGGVISPLLSNIFLHEVMDKWMHETVFPQLREKAFEVRYADDVVLCFKNKEDALRVLKVLPKRLKRYGLEMHPEKTKLVEFKMPRDRKGGYKQGKRPDTFDFLGFTHFWKKSRKGRPVIGKKTGSSRLSKGLKKMKKWCRENRHMKLQLQHERMCSKVRGHYNYYGVNGNYRMLAKFLREAERIWRKWLERRGRKRNLNWEKMKKILEKFSLPKPYILHSCV